MERKIATYTEKNERLQLVRIGDSCDDPNRYFEIRANRVLIERFPADKGAFARLYFYHCVHEIVINRSTSMLKLT